MPLKKKITLALYILSLLVYSVFRIQNLDSLALIVQPFLLITLAAYYFISTSKINMLFLVALLFLLVGSLFFLNHTLERFMIGMGLYFNVSSI